MPKYLKKSEVVEAFQMTRERRWDNSEWPNWLNEAWNMEPSEGALWCVDGSEQLHLGTREGIYDIVWGDFIIQGFEGELYPCRPKTFAKTYEEVEDEK